MTLFKKNFLSAFFILCPLVMLFGQTDWSWLNPLPQGHRLYAVTGIPGTDRIAAAGGGGTIMITDDNGESWDITYLAGGADFDIYTVFFTDSSTGFAGGRGGVLQTRDGGKTWELIDPGVENVDARSIVFTDENTGYIAGSRQLLLKTEDGGKSWYRLVEEFFWRHYNRLVFPDDTTGYLLANEHGETYLYKTIDSGHNWVLIDIGTDLYIDRIHFLDADTGFIIGGAYYKKIILCITEDGGRSWRAQELTDQIQFSSSMRDIHFTDINTGYIGDGAGIYKTTDRGISWTQVNEAGILSLYFRDADHAWAAGSIGSLYRSTDSGDTWQALHKNVFENVDFRTVFFTDSETGYAAGYTADTYITKTHDGGQNWEKLDISGRHIEALHFFDDNRGFAGGSTGLLKTTDGGLSWTAGYDGITDPILAIHFPTESHGYLAGYKGNITEGFESFVYKTADSGRTWHVFDLDISEFNYACTVHFADTSTGFIGGNQLIKTEDGGKSWRLIAEDILYPFPRPSVTSIFFTDCQTGYLGTYYGTYKTEDGGLAWTGIRETGSASLFFTAPDTGYSLGGAGLYSTFDAGESWERVFYLPYADFGDIHFPDKHTGYVVGRTGAIFRLSQTVTSVFPSPPPPVFPTHYLLFQNYPNPFNTSTVIRFDLPAASHVELSVYNLAGREIARLKEGNMTPGIHTVHFDGTDLPSGVYIARLKMGKEVFSRRMLLLK